MTATTSRLSRPTVFLHWTLALLMIGMLAFGLYLENMPRSPEKGALRSIHISVGLFVLVLAVGRVLWRIKEGFPSELSEDPAWQSFAAHAAHIVLLLGTILMPLSGITMNLAGGSGLSFFGIELVASQRGNPDFVANEALDGFASAAHGIGGSLLILVIALHIAGAFKHHLVDRDGTLRRMLGRAV